MTPPSLPAENGPTKPPKSSDPINADVDSYCWHDQGWECAGEGTVRDARKVSRGKAGAFFARMDGGDILDVRVWKRYVRPLTRLDSWEDRGQERWAEAHDIDPEDAPDHPPEDWEPDWEGDPSWEFVHKSHPEAIPVWVCATKDSEPPHNPQRRVAA